MRSKASWMIMLFSIQANNCRKIVAIDKRKIISKKLSLKLIIIWGTWFHTQWAKIILSYTFIQKNN